MKKTGGNESLEGTVHVLLPLYSYCQAKQVDICWTFKILGVIFTFLSSYSDTRPPLACGGGVIACGSGETQCSLTGDQAWPLISLGTVIGPEIGI